MNMKCKAAHVCAGLAGVMPHPSVTHLLDKELSRALSSTVCHTDPENRFVVIQLEVFHHDLYL